MVEFEHNLKLLRMVSGESQAKVAEAIGVTRSAYSQYERGARRPDIEILSNISEYFKIPMEFLFNPHRKKFLNDINIYKGLCEEELKLLTIFESLTEYSKGRLVEYATCVLENDNERFIPKSEKENSFHMF
jgi:transcriptional regulator with XRE-family HTH domain